MLKKILYIIMGSLFILFLYNNYIKEDDIEIQNVNENVKTENIRYNIGKNYQIEADNLVENKENEKTYFKTAKAIFDTLKISGKEAVVDKYQNMILKGDILGETNSGWEFTTDEINFDEKKEMFFSKSKIEAENSEEEMTIVANKFEANSGFTVINLIGDVKLQTPGIELTSKRVRYDRESKIVKFTTNIRFKAKDLDSGKGKIDRVSGRMNSAIYDLDRGKLTIWGKFEIYYMGYIISANNLMYYRDTGNINVYDNVNISKRDIQVNMRKMYYNDETKKMVLTGPIEGNKGKYNFEAKYGEINTETEDVRIIEDVIVNNTEKDMKLFSDELKYISEKEKIEIKGNREIKIQGEKFVATSKNAEYYLTDNILEVNNSYKFTQDQLQVTGEKLIFNTETQKRGSEDNKLENRDLFMESSFLEFNLEEEKYDLKRDVKVKKGEYTLETDNMVINNISEKINIEDEFKVYSSKNDFTLNGKNGEFNNINSENKTLVIKDGSEITKDNYIINSKELRYNLEDESAELNKDVSVINKEQGIDLKANRGTYKKDEDLVLYDEIDIKKDGNNLLTDKLTYNLDTKDIILDEKGKLKNSDRNYEINYQSGNYDEKTGQLKLKEIDGTQDDTTIKSKRATYDSEKEVLTLIDDVKITRDGTIINGSKLNYYMKNSDIITNEEIHIKKENVLIVAQYAKINLDNEYLESKEAVITTDKGDKLSGNEMSGKLSDMEFNFKGDLQADLTNDIYFSGDTAKMFFIENENNQYEVTRGEIKDNTEFIYGQMYLTSDYLEIDNYKNLVFGKGNPKLKVQDNTEVVAEYIYLELDKELGRMENNVKMTNTGLEEAGTVNATSDKAILRNEERKIEFLGNVEVYKGKNIVQTDKGTMDLDTNVLSGVGNTKFKLSVDKKDEGE